MPEPPAHAEYGKDSEQRRGHRAHADEAVHIRRPLQQGADPHDVVAPIQIHDRQHEHKLRERECYRVRGPVEYGPHDIRHRQAEQLGEKPMHRYVQRRQQEDDRPDQAMLHLGGCLFERLLRWCCRGNRRRCGPERSLYAGSIAGLFHGGNDGLRIRDLRIILELHRVRQQIDSDIFRALELRHGLLYAGRAGRAAHARYIEFFLFQDDPFFVVPRQPA